MAQDSPDPSPARWPSFYENEIVRVVDVGLTGGPERKETLLGTEGTVMGFTPDPENTGRWAICVWLPVINRGIDFWEHQLESTGFSEVYDDHGAFEGIGGERVSRVPLTAEDPSEHWGAELWVQLLVPITDEPLEDIATRADVVLRALIPLDQIRWQGERHWRVDGWDIDFDLWPSEGSREGFEQLVAAYDLWQEQSDDGWEGFFGWWRMSARQGEECFILPEAESIFVTRRPWSDPTYRPIPTGRQPPSMPRINQRPEPDE
jgi:hypothetical protein